VSSKDRLHILKPDRTLAGASNSMCSEAQELHRRRLKAKRIARVTSCGQGIIAENKKAVQP